MINSAPEECLRKIADIFIGDDGDFYSYKSGSQIVAFFNRYFGYTDSYGRGFPSRWLYVVDKLSALIDIQLIDVFFTLVLSLQYIAEDNKCTEVEAAGKVCEIFETFKKAVFPYGFEVIHAGKEYKIVRRNDDFVVLGHGGFADCYKQISTGLVVKKLKTEWLTEEGVRSRFKREFEITKGLQNLDGIIKVYDFDAGNYSYTMELADCTLADFLSRNAINEETKIWFIHRILEIMSQVHSRNVLHRDLSPTNIFIKGRIIEIGDFGLGKDLSTIASHQTQYTNHFGQFYYCAPEQIKRLKDADKRSDVFSLGRIINYIMTNDPANSVHAFRNVAEKATNNNPSNRYEDAGDLLAAFNKSVEYRNNAKSKEIALQQIHNGQFTDEVENFIYSLPGEDVCRYLVKREPHFDEALLKLMVRNDSQAASITSEIAGNFRDICTTFESYDPIADFAYDCIGGVCNLAQITAAKVLRFIAEDVNRFHAQRLIENLRGSGLDSEIMEILWG